VVAGQREIMGGASLPLSAGVANVMRFAGLDLKTAVRMATHHPAELLGLEPVGIEPDAPASLFQFDLLPQTADAFSPGLRVHCTVVEGEVTWGTPWQPPPLRPGT
jgi:N-acetylglucosamine-6-phosphate deacetylase